MKRKSAIVLAAFVASLSTLLAQERAIKPLDVPMSFSGSYGELRRNHFHGGLDWRVDGRIGDPVRAIKSGYVWKVTVSPYGYGNGMYVKHNDGTMSVYGHLDSFMAPVAARVKSAQYEKESFNVQLEFAPDEYPVSQGDVIARAGNTGSSGGPHLHMEVRDADNVPLNYIAMGYYKPVDKSSPRIARVAFYAYDNCTPVANSFRVKNIPNPDKFTELVLLPRETYLAVDAYDIQEGTTGKLAVEEYRVSLDERNIFRFKIGDVGFEDGADICSLIEYRESYRGGRDMVKTALDPGNSLRYKVDTLDGGHLRLDDYDTHTVKVEAVDEHGNASVVRIRVRRSDSVEVPAEDTLQKRETILWYTPNMVRNMGFTYLLTPGSLYRSFNLYWDMVCEANPQEGIYSPVWKIGDPWIPLKRNGALTINFNGVPSPIYNKAYTASYPGLSYAGPLKDARVPLGVYCVAVDTEGPVISIDKNNVIKVRDAYSGTASVRVEIDGKWHLSRFKGGRVTILDRASLKKGSHLVKVIAVDNMGNESTVKKQMIL